MNPDRNFDRVAHIYDETRPTPAPISEHGIPAILKAAGPGARILDVGTGTGRLAVPLLEQGADLTGIDISANMLAIHRAKAPAARLVRGSALDLPFGDGRFDAVLTSHVLHLLPDWRAALVEFKRIVRPGGVYINARAESTGESAYGRAGDFWLNWLVEHGGRPYGEHVGIWDQGQINPELERLGATLEVIDVVAYEERRTLRRRVEGFRSRSSSSTWDIPDDLLAASADALETWVIAEYGGLDVEIVEPSVFRLYLARFR